MSQEGLVRFATQGAWDPYEALYIHVPFCKRRCRYCDFTTQAMASDSPVMDDYVEHLIEQIRAYSNADELGHLKTVYLGGGTPSYLGNKRLSSILYALSVSMHLTPEVECTLEANPESVTLALVKDLYALGVTRISLGVQSFDDGMLQLLGRIHTADMTRRALEAIFERFSNVSIDFMCGLPGQTQESFQRDLEEALSRGVKHISVYPLAIEPGTPFERMVQEGTLAFDEDASVDFMEQAHGFLLDHGFEHYEVSNYDLPGFESRHNSAYWTGRPYLGLGTGAVGMRQNALCRERFNEAEGVFETLDPFQMAAEDLMLGMRLAEGVLDEDVEVDALLLPALPQTLSSLEQEGYVIHDAGRWKPTHKGWLFGNQLSGRLWSLADDAQ